MTTAILVRSPAAAATVSSPTPTRSTQIALAGAAASIPPIVLLHLDAPASLSATRTTISDFVVTTPLGEPLFGLTTGALAVAGIAIAKGLAGRPGTGAVRALLAMWAVALVAAALFPTNRPGSPGDTASTIHLIAGGIVFALLPAAGVLVWRRLRTVLIRPWIAPTLLVTALISAVLSTALIINRLPAAFGLDLMIAPGLLQRAAGAAEIVLTAVIALALARTHRARS